MTPLMQNVSIFTNCLRLLECLILLSSNINPIKPTVSYLMHVSKASKLPTCNNIAKK